MQFNSSPTASSPRQRAAIYVFTLRTRDSQNTFRCPTMEMSRLQPSCRPDVRRRVRARGFALIEVLVALVVLAIGLVSLAALTAQMENGTERARFMGLAANLATEKLEDLNRWPSWDPNVSAPAGGTSGSLTTDA